MLTVADEVSSAAATPIDTCRVAGTVAAMLGYTRPILAAADGELSTEPEDDVSDSLMDEGMSGVFPAPTRRGR